MQDDDAMIEKREISTHVRLGEQADATLEMLAASHGTTKSAHAAAMLTRMLLGEGHVLKLLAERMTRSGSQGSAR